MKENLERCNTEFITKEKRKLESDVLYKIKNTQKYILIEHQSKIDYSMPKRILEYCVEIMRMVEKSKKINYRVDKLPVIYPIVLYTGKRKWNANIELSKMQEEIKGIQKNLKSSYTLVDSNDMSIEELILERTAISKAILLEKIKTKKELIEILEQVVRQPLNIEERSFIIDVITNTAKEKIEKIKYDEFLRKISKKGGEEDMVMENLRRIWDVSCQEARAEGKNEGISQGISQGIRQIAKKMLKSKMSEKTIKAMTQISDEELEELKKEIV